MPQGRIKFDGATWCQSLSVIASMTVGFFRCSALLCSALLSTWYTTCLCSCFHVHITMRGEASWQTSITFTRTRTHAKNARAQTLLPTSEFMLIYKSIMNHQYVTFVTLLNSPRYSSSIDIRYLINNFAVSNNFKSRK